MDYGNCSFPTPEGAEADTMFKKKKKDYLTVVPKVLLGSFQVGL